MLLGGLQGALVRVLRRTPRQVRRSVLGMQRNRLAEAGHCVDRVRLLRTVHYAQLRRDFRGGQRQIGDHLLLHADHGPAPDRTEGRGRWSGQYDEPQLRQARHLRRAGELRDHRRLLRAVELRNAGYAIRAERCV